MVVALPRFFRTRLGRSGGGTLYRVRLALVAGPPPYLCDLGIVGEALHRDDGVQPHSQSRPHPLWLLAGFWFCVAIALAAVLRRLIALARPLRGEPPGMAVIDATFSAHAGLTVMHIVPAAIFVVLAACLLLRRSGGEWLERFFYPFGAITGATAYAMSAYAIGGWIERAAVLVFNSWFLLSLGRSYWWRLRGEEERKREWMIRAVGVLLGIATTRPVMGVFFATSARTHLDPNQFFGIAFWAGFSINVAVTEFWLRSRRRRPAGKMEQ